LKIARSNRDPADKIDLLTIISTECKKQKRKLSNQIRLEALSFLPLLGDGWTFVTSLEKITNSGDSTVIQESKPLIEQARRIIPGIESPQLQCMATADIIAIYGTIGSAKTVDSLSAEFTRLAKKVPAYNWSYYYGAISKVYCALRNEKKSKEFMNYVSLEIIADTIARKRVDEYLAIADNFKGGCVDDWLKNAIHKAKGEIPVDKNIVLRIFLTRKLVDLLIYFEQVSVAKQVISKNIQLLDSIGNTGDRARMAYLVANECFLLKMETEARMIGQRSLSDADSIEDNDQKIDMRAEVLHKLALILPKELVEKEVDELVSRINNPYR
jgi:hypothetical protein